MKEQEDFDAMKEFIESQFDPNRHVGNDFTPDIIMYMMDKIRKVAEEHKIAAEAQEEDDLNIEIQQWNNINKALSKADKVIKSLKNESKLGKQN